MALLTQLINLMMDVTHTIYSVHVSFAGCLIEGNSYYGCFLLLQVHFSCVCVMETTDHRVRMSVVLCNLILTRSSY